MLKTRRAFVGLLTSAMTLVPVREAQADEYSEKVVVQTESKEECRRLAVDVAHKLIFRAWKGNPNGVAGEKEDVYVTITCLDEGGGSKAAVEVKGTSLKSFSKETVQRVAGEIQAVSCSKRHCQP